LRKKLLIGVLLVSGVAPFMPARWFFPEYSGVGPDPCILRDSTTVKKMIRVAR
jgi:hypothetical protein